MEAIKLARKPHRLNFILMTQNVACFGSKECENAETKKKKTRSCANIVDYLKKSRVVVQIQQRFLHIFYHQS